MGHLLGRPIIRAIDRGSSISTLTAEVRPGHKFLLQHNFPSILNTCVDFQILTISITSSIRVNANLSYHTYQ